MSERQTKRRRKLLNASWYWLNETGVIDPRVWNSLEACTSFVAPTQTQTLTVASLRAFRDAMMGVQTPLTLDHWFVLDQSDDDFDPRNQGPPRPLDELVASVLDYEGLEDESV